MAALRDHRDENSLLQDWQERLEHLDNATFVLDTCSYLHLFRSRGEEGRRLSAAIDSVKDRLWVPHQVLVEFVGNSPTIVGSILQEAEIAAAEVGMLMQRLDVVARRQMRRIAAEDPRGKNALRNVELAVRTLQQVLVSAGHHGSDPEPALTAHAIAVADQVKDIMTGRVGPEPTASKWARWIEDSRKRVRYGHAPSWGDRKKKEPLRHSDCLIWHELLEFALGQPSGRAIAFVTEDLKEGSWVEHRNGRAVGAHPDLVHEMQDKAATPLIVLTPANLTAYAAHSESKRTWEADLGWGEEAPGGSLRPIRSFFAS
ncbi:Uncharacterised protein [Amycolatopsis camponoti]|uniref:PIN like domain-containing protein n=2 Tax=Amycolatopsis camponoti TaxID=2606593 RepID=A0A6I8M258_9PSEU|nr:Uncharacterised protein [Amycolatopsis camponoti]